MFRPRAFGVLLVGAMALAGIAGMACGGTVGRGTPVPDRTPSISGTGSPVSGATATSPAASPIPTPTRTPAPGTPGPAQALSTLTPRSVLPTATPRPVVTDPVVTVSTELTLDVFGIGDETIVKGSSIIVAGRTRADAVLSINGVIIPMDDQGRFEVTVALNMGPNLIEVVASDLNGNQKSRILLVTALEPEA